VANAWPDSYTNVLNHELTLGIGAASLTEPLVSWINEGLMTIFFFVVGLEIKRELLIGELSRPKQAILPVMAATGGMLVPAGIYMLINASGDGFHGWGIPMATDIAFAIGVLALLKKRIPFALKVFLTALAIIDDIGAVIIIAVFYTGSVSWGALAAALGLFVLLLLANRLGVMSVSVYMLLGFGLWLTMFDSGVHATVAGVLLALAIPSRTGRKDTSTTPSEPPLQKLERVLEPWVAYLIVPVFALANAGVRFSDNPLASLSEPIGLGIVLGLVLGKQLGVTLFSWIAVRTGIGSMPRGVTWRHLHGAACLAGIGFTMSLFVTLLAFEQASQLEAAKIAILAASLIAGLLGWTLLFKAKAKS